MAATHTAEPNRAARRWASSASRPTASMPPDPAVLACRRDRWNETVAASRSESAPLTYAAATSPTLCPTTAVGRIPNCCKCFASADCTRKLAGWAISVRLTRESACGRSSSAITDQPEISWKTSSISAAASRKIPGRSNKARAIPHHCGPMPLKTNTGSEIPSTRARGGAASSLAA